MERYGHQIVIGNDLNRRKHEVVFVEREGDTFQEKWLTLQSGENERGEREIERDIVSELQARHERWISQGPSAVSRAE